MRVFSYGGGVQSTAVMVLAKQGLLQYDSMLFCNVGEDSENPDTLRYFYDVAMPYASKHDITLIELRKYRFTEIETVYQRAVGPTRSIPLPVRMKGGAPGRRTCTTDFKIRVIASWQKRNGATRENPAITGLGISVDEYRRARTDSGFDFQVLEYPLIDRRLSRQDCINIILDEGLPVPPRSSCYFCPYKTREDWINLKRQKPELFSKAIELETRLNEKRKELEKDEVYLHGALVPLDRAVGDQLIMFDEEDNCESGYCFV